MDRQREKGGSRGICVLGELLGQHCCVLSLQIIRIESDANSTFVSSKSKVQVAPVKSVHCLRKYSLLALSMQKLLVCLQVITRHAD